MHMLAGSMICYVHQIQSFQNGACESYKHQTVTADASTADASAVRTGKRRFVALWPMRSCL